MHRQIYQKVIFHLSLLGIVVSVLVSLYDVIFGHLFEVCHILFEVVESTLDKIVEHFFETELHDTQMIVFYVMLVLGSILIYFVWKALVKLCSGFNHNIHQEWAELATAVADDWRAMSIMNRILLVTAFLVVNYLASFLLF